MRRASVAGGACSFTHANSFETPHRTPLNPPQAPTHALDDALRALKRQAVPLVGEPQLPRPRDRVGDHHPVPDRHEAILGAREDEQAVADFGERVEDGVVAH